LDDQAVTAAKVGMAVMAARVVTLQALAMPAKVALVP
jgi:hypothetical protein